MSMMVMLASSAAMAMPASRRRFRLVVRVRPITFEDLLDMRACLTIRRNAAVTLHGVGAGVVGGERQLQIAVELLQQRIEVTRPGIEILRRIERVRDAQLARRGWHELHQALRALARD